MKTDNADIESCGKIVTQQRDELYVAISHDALKLIESLDLPIQHRLRMAVIFAMLSANVTTTTTKWGATACYAWTGIAEKTTSHILKELEKLQLSDGEQLLEFVEYHGAFRVRRPTRRNPILIPRFIFRRRNKAIGNSYIEEMFHRGEQFPVKAWRLMMLMTIYEKFDEQSLCCHGILMSRLEPDLELSDDQGRVQVSRADTRVWLPPGTPGLMLPRTPKKRDAAVGDAMTWLAENGLVSLLRVVVADDRINYVASYQSKFWNKQRGNFQTRIRSVVQADPYNSSGEFDGFVFVMFAGGDLYETIAPQYQVSTQITKVTARLFRMSEDEIIDDYGDWE